MQRFLLFTLLFAAVLAANTTEAQKGSVVSLKRSSLKKAIKSDKAVFVKFFAPWCGHCKALAPVWEQLAKETKEDIVIAEVNCDDHSKVCEQQNVQGFPTIKLFYRGQTYEYEGRRTVEEFNKFIKKTLHPEIKEKKEEKKEEKKAESPVFSLTEKNFDTVLKEKKTMFVKFFAPWCGHCKALAPTWEQLAKETKDILIGEVNCVENSKLCRAHKVSGYPTVILFHDEKSDEYEGRRTVEEFNKFIKKTLHPEIKEEKKEEKKVESPVFALTEKNFDTVLKEKKTMFVKFFAPWCGHCKALAPTWEQLAKETKDILIGEVNCDENSKLCNRNEVRGYPTVKLFHDGKADKFSGPRTVEEFNKFIKKTLHPEQKKEL